MFTEIFLEPFSFHVQFSKILEYKPLGLYVTYFIFMSGFKQISKFSRKWVQC